MPADRRPSALRSTLLRWAVPVVVVLPLLVVPSPAGAAGETVVGELVQAWGDDMAADMDADAHEDGREDEASADEGLLTWVQPARGDAVRVPTGDLPAGVEPGATVEVTLGGEVADAAGAEGLEPARAVLDVEVLEAAPVAAAVSPGTTNQVTVVLVRPGGAPADGRTVQQVVDAVNGPVGTFWSEQSAGAVELEVTASRSWLTTTATCASPQQLFAEVDAAVGWRGAPGDHLLLYIPPGTAGCSDGLATIGSGVGDGGLLYVTGVLTSLVAHEFGHNFSLGHASSLRCDRTLDVGDCLVYEYDDYYDVMGISWPQVGSLGAPHAARLGLLPPARYATITTADARRTVTLTPTSSSTGLRALRVLGGDGSVYWLEYRTASGQDSWLGTGANTRNLQSGVLLRLAENGDQTSLLLDGSPSAPSGWDADNQVALTAPGQEAVLGDGDFVVRVTSMTPADVVLEVLAPFEARYEDPAVAAALGPPTGAQTCGLPRGGCLREYTNGNMYWSAATGARYVLPPVLDRYTAAGPGSPLRYPVEDTDCPTPGECLQAFQGGFVTSISPTEVRAVWGAIGAAWGASGGPQGPAGLPVTEERCGLRDGGCYQVFDGAVGYWSRASGARFVDEGFMPAYRARGYENGRLRYPLRDTFCGLRDGGCVQSFQGGLLYRSGAAEGAVVGAIRARYAAARYENGVLRYPVGDERCSRSGGACVQGFQGGRIVWTSGTGARVVLGAIGAAWDQGAHGWPTSEEICGLVRRGCFQRFQRATIYWSPATGARAVGQLSPQIARAWGDQGWERGGLGYPVTPERVVRGGFAQRFEGGTLVHDVRTGRVRRI